MLGGRQGQVNEGHACGSLAVDGNSGHCLNMRLRYLPNPPGSRQRKRSALLNAQKANAVGQILGHIHVRNPLGNLYVFPGKGLPENSSISDLASFHRPTFIDLEQNFFCPSDSIEKWHRWLAEPETMSNF